MRARSLFIPTGEFLMKETKPSKRVSKVCPQKTKEKRKVVARRRRRSLRLESPAMGNAADGGKSGRGARSRQISEKPGL